SGCWALLPPAKRRAVRSTSSALSTLSSRSHARTVRQVSLPLVTTPSDRSVFANPPAARDGEIDRSCASSATPAATGDAGGSGRTILIGVFMREEGREEAAWRQATDQGSLAGCATTCGPAASSEFRCFRHAGQARPGRGT